LDAHHPGYRDSSDSRLLAVGCLLFIDRTMTEYELLANKTTQPLSVIKRPYITIKASRLVLAFVVVYQWLGDTSLSRPRTEFEQSGISFNAAP